MLVQILGIAITRLVAVYLHEMAHALAAVCLGFSPSISVSLLGHSWTAVPGLALQHSRSVGFVRHCGWMFSTMLAIVAALAADLSQPVVAVLAFTALDSIYSDLLLGG